MQTTFSPDASIPFLREWELLMLVRVFLAQQQYEQAVETLSRFSQQLDRPGAIDTVLEWMALQLVALHHTGERAQAARVAARLFAMTEPEGHLRVYLDEGIRHGQALEALLSAPADDEPGVAAVPFPDPTLCACWRPLSRREEHTPSPSRKRLDLRPLPSALLLQKQRSSSHLPGVSRKSCACLQREPP